MCVNYGRVVNSMKKTMQFAVTSGSDQELIFMPNEASRTVDGLNITSGKKEFSLTGHYSYVNCSVFHPDKHELYTAGSDRNILVWRPNMKNSLYTSGRKVKKITKKTIKVENIKTENETVVKIEPGIVVKQEEAPSVQTSVTADSWSSDEET